MAGEDKVCKLLHRYRTIFAFLGIVLVIQVVIAVRLIFIADNPNSDQAHGRGLPVDHSEQHNHGWREQLKSHSDAKSHSKTFGATNNSTSPHKLNLESLNFVPECEIDGKETVSAITRAKTHECKKYLADTTCKLVNEVLYPKRLPRFCVTKESTYMKYVGCFRDEKKSRLLPEHYILQKETNSPGNCIDVCLQFGFAFAGVQYGVECFCGNTRPPESALLQPTDCNMKCPSISFTKNTSDSAFENEDDNTCGGYYAMSVFETGMFKGEAPVKGLRTDSDTKLNTSSNEPVRIVFFLTLNGRALRQVIRLIKTLFHQRHYFYVHVDARQDYLFRQLLSLETKLQGNVRFMRDRRSTIWGGASLLKVLLAGMAELVEKSEDWGWNWDYVVNLSESDFPLKTVDQLETFLTLNKGKNFLKSHGRDVQKFVQKQGLDKTFDECEFRMWRLSDRKLPLGILIDGGSDWVVLHYDFVKYLATTDDDLVKGLKIVFGYTLLPAESFFHTTLRNSRFCETFVDNNLRITNWKRKLGCKCQYRSVVDWCGCSPNDFRLSDWSRLEATESKLLFFGRKFEPVVNQAVINQLESRLVPSRFTTNFPTIDRYWQSIYHQHDLSPKPDDSVLTLGFSLSRIATQHFARSSFQKLGLGTSDDPRTLAQNLPVHVTESSVYVHNNEVQGILVRFDIALSEKSSVQLQSWFSPLTWIHYEPFSVPIQEYHSKIQAIRVGTDYDQKEQIFRNFAGSIGPMSEPILAYHCYSDDPLNITFVWMNPSHVAQSVNNFSVSQGETANFVKPTLKMPLQPGNWTVKILSQEGSLIAVVKFVVVPLQFYQGKPVSTTQEKRARVASEAEQNSDYSNENHTSQDHWDWIDGFVSKFYQLQDTCIAEAISPADMRALYNILRSNGDHNSNSVFKDDMKGINDYNILEMTLCSHSQWSSLYPDPKSTISGIDPVTGLLLP